MKTPSSLPAAGGPARRVFTALALAFAAFAIPAGLSADEGPDSILRALDAQKRFVGADFSYDLAMETTDGSGSVKRSAMRVFRRDASRKLVALVLEPASHLGEGYLRLDRNLWFFDAETGAYIHSVLSDAISESEMESGDIEPDSLAESYSVASVTEARLGANDCRVLLLEERGVQPYPRMRVWARKGDGLLLKEEYYGASGRLMRSVLYPVHKRIGGRTFASSTIYVDALDERRRTVATLSNPSFEPIPEKVFSKSFLERTR